MTDGRVVTKVIDADGAEVQVTLAAPRVTVSYERKITGTVYGFPSEYDNAVAGVHVQADVALDGSDRQAAITEAFGIAKSAVIKQLGLESTVNDDNVVIEKLVQATGGAVVSSKPKGRPAPKRSTGDAGPKKSQADLWADLSANPGSWFDNRNDKRSPSAPDFKRKGTGEGLWIKAQDGSDNAETYGATLP